MPSKRSSTKSLATKPEPKVPSSRRKLKTTSLSTGTARTAPCHLVVDLSLPSHVVNDRSLFTTYTPSRKLHQTPFGNDIVIEGRGDVHVRAFAGGKSILFHLRDCWHVPSSPHHFLSCISIVSQGKQVMLADRTPRMIYSHKDRLTNPELPKYVPFTREGGHFVLKFQIPIGVSGIQPAAAPSVSLHASSSQVFASLSFHSHPFIQNPVPASHSPILSSLINSSTLTQKSPSPSLIRTPLSPLSILLSNHPSLPNASLLAPLSLLASSSVLSTSTSSQPAAVLPPLSISLSEQPPPPKTCSPQIPLVYLLCMGVLSLAMH
ncbi:hypothetical protein GALMADRAFT_229963 [Galerina marginata CBS 339.88]|uniref:Retrovirus-related Pol polyprotein from transposon TNT 1-94-like beta-barrel domain-containing protein n=1 Tax=Galerina marginata (strain CBS 339.88) TaxID=685588 RepID=A0A067SUZ4_GALM3|nr:hypothetical protein GALMADRAFT_229963 [Galerina marginata CBS 339.88]